jgi:hypothetical protein
LIGRVTAIAGSQATAELNLRAASGDHPTVGKFMGLMTGGSLTVGMISEVREQSAASNGHASHKCAQLDLIGEVRTGSNGTARFQELPPNLRPNSDAAGDTRSDAGNNISRELISSVIERWRSASMSCCMSDDDLLDNASPFDSLALQPAQAAAPVAPAAPSLRGEALRSSLLKKPLDAATFGGRPANPPGYPPKFR